MSWAIDVLLHDTAMWQGEAENAAEESARKRKRMEALECLAYVQDVLSRGSIGGVDEGRLLGESEVVRRKKDVEEGAVADVSTPISRAQEASIPVPKSDPLGGRPKTMLSTRDSKPSVSLPRTIVRPPPINPPIPDPLALPASVVSPRNIPLPYSANTTWTPLQRSISRVHAASTEELRSSLSTNLPVTRSTRSVFSSTNSTPTTSLPYGGHHASSSSISISNAVYTHGHRKNKLSEDHVPSSSPPTSAKADPSEYPPSPNTYPLLSPSKSQAARVVFDPLGALG